MDYGLIGKKLSHSFSVGIHTALYGYDYKLCEIGEDGLRDFFKARDFKGINVTIPYKETAYGYMDVLSDGAKRTGVINTVVNRDGRLYGYNTDFDGLLALILKNNIEITGKKAVILGGGATSKTAGAVLSHLNAREIHTVSASGRTGCISYEQMYKEHTDADVIINTTPCGMYPDIYSSAVTLDAFANLSAVVDVVYNPLNTELVLSAGNRGITAVGGLFMLVSQAAVSGGLFTGDIAPDEKITEVYMSILQKCRNIVLIGMPGSGKTTVGKQIANRLGREFFDTDAVIENTVGKSCADIIKNEGETEFRRLERDAVRSVCTKTGTVIATGGGTVLSDENMHNLKRNGLIVFADTPVSELSADCTHPLSDTAEKLNALYEKRYPLYKRYADITLDEFMKEL